MANITVTLAHPISSADALTLGAVNVRNYLGGETITVPVASAHRLVNAGMVAGIDPANAAAINALFGLPPTPDPNHLTYGGLPAPTALGVDGDLYLRSNGDMYRQVSGAWVLQAPAPYTWDNPARHSLKEWNYPPDLMGPQAGVPLVSGTIYGMRLDAQGGQVLNNITVNIGTAGAALTVNQCVAVVVDCTTGSAVELARTGNLATILTGTGPTDLPLIAPFTPVAGQKLAVLLLVVGTTPPALVRTDSAAVTGPNVGLVPTSPLRYFTVGTAQTTVTTPVALSGAVAAGAFTLWAALK